jgi:hypothetical protein
VRFSRLCVTRCVAFVKADDLYKKDPAAKFATNTPIKHLVVIFDENNSFDHYFGTYPNALNLPGETSKFYPAPDTPLVSGGSNPFRLAPSQAATCNNSNNCTLEQEAFDGGLLDKFSLTSAKKACGFFLPTPPLLLSMGYYDGNTVTALWNYAQRFSMSDNFFDTLFGVTVSGHMNLLSGQTNGLIVKAGAPVSPSVISNGTIIANVQPYYDECAAGVTPKLSCRERTSAICSMPPASVGAGSTAISRPFPSLHSAASPRRPARGSTTATTHLLITTRIRPIRTTFLRAPLPPSEQTLVPIRCARITTMI